MNARVVAALGRRSIMQTFRRPQLMAPILIFPTVLLAIQTAGAGRAVDLPQFPEVNGFLDFMVAGAMVQSAMLGGNSGGIAFALDLESGFADRLFAAPISRYSIVLGRLVGTAVLGAFTALWFTVIALVFGVQFEGGIAAVALVFALVIGSALAFGTLGSALALRAGNASTVQGMFPLVFVILFLSTAFFPENLLKEPAQTVAVYNPLSFIVESIRDPVVSGIAAGPIADGLASLLAVSLFGLVLAGLALRRRMRTGE